MNVRQQTCLNHAAREAVARCPQCAHFYCRECITEHDDRVLCAACLRKLLKPAAARGRALAVPTRVLALALGLCTAWFAWYFVGRTLLKIPTSIHDGTVWTTSFWQE